MSTIEAAKREALEVDQVWGEGQYTGPKPTPADIEQLRADFEASAPKTAVAVTAADLMTRELPPRHNLLAPWLPTQGLAMVYAPRGVGKTFFALEVAYAVASGGKFLCWDSPNPCKVLYLDGEMPAVVMKERLIHIVEKAEKDAEADALGIVTPDLQGDGFMPNLATPGGQAAIAPLLDGVGLVIVDNISTLCRGGKENEAESWIPVQKWALSLRARGVSVLFVHHAGKDGAQRGSSKREDVLDTVINLRRPNDYDPTQGAAFEVHFQKSRGFTGENAEPLDVQLIDCGNGKMSWSWKKLENSTYEKILDLHGEGLKPADIARELDVNRSTVSRHLKKAKARGAI